MQAVRMMQRMNLRIGAIRDTLDVPRLKTPVGVLGAASRRPRRSKPRECSSGEHDRVAAADGPTIDHRGVDADVYCVMLSSGAEDS